MRRQNTLRRFDSDIRNDDDPNSKKIDDIVPITSENYYEDILFDYLKVFYEKAIKSEFEA